MQVKYLNSGHAFIGILIFVFTFSRTLHASPIDPPAWAYAGNPPSEEPDTDSLKTLKHVPDSAIFYTADQVDDLFLAPDWHPKDHGVPPPVVSQGRKPDVFACGYCHRVDGSGGPENAKLAGLPYDYIVSELRAFQNGSRTSSIPTRIPQKFMIALSKSLTSDEIDEAAKYFSTVPARNNIHVVEAEFVPKVLGKKWRLVVAPGSTMEPIGGRIIEVPDNSEDFENRDSRATFTAYVPPGSIARGQNLVRAATSEKVSCVSCHGEQLQGNGAIPSLAGRSPTYLVRQFVDIQRGARRLDNVEPMRLAVETLNLEDMIAISAYAASLKTTR